ncbi:borealin-like isoform X1 [Euwallacea similis]|uniref:borealin-like isoform X1 n=1 Tax=Euwallacea similis TaxID=1736056 RepID=UPI00344E1AD2
MPRTKKAPVAKALVKVKASDRQEYINAAIRYNEQNVTATIEKMVAQNLEKIHAKYKKIRLNLGKNLLSMTVADIENGDVHSSDLYETLITSSTLLADSSQLNSMSSSSISHKTRVLHVSRSQTVTKTRSSRSFSCDEGYTTESVRSTASGEKNERQTRSMRRPRASERKITRSLSRPTNTTNAFITPLNKQPPTSAGTITPKVQPNTSLLYMRRPKVGEMAWSNQGSPLMVSAAEQSANVNIPVGGDAVLSLLPNRGVLRESQVPILPDETRRQLEILRDNLIKVCTVSSNQHG